MNEITEGMPAVRHAPHNADAFFGVIDREGADQVGLGVAEYADLPAVIVLGFGNAHRVVDLVAVAARSDIGRRSR